MHQQPSNVANASIDQTSFQMGQPPPIMMPNSLQQCPPQVDQIEVAPDPTMQSSMGVMDYGRIQQQQGTFTPQHYQQGEKNNKFEKINLLQLNKNFE